MNFKVKVAVSKIGNVYKVIGVQTESGFRSLGFLKDYDGAFLLDLTAREYADLPCGIYDIK